MRSTPRKLTRRDFAGLTAATAALPLLPASLLAQAAIPGRAIPATGEQLPVIGLGSSKVVGEIAEHGTTPVANVLRTLLAEGGTVVDTWPRNPANDAGFGSVISQPDFTGRLFVTTKVDQPGREAGIAQLDAALSNYQLEQIDLAQIFSLTDVYTHWPTLRAFKDAGRARYIGVTVAENNLYGELETFLAREQPDFIQVNFSITERESEARILPLAADQGVAVIINRPFMNGAYFDRLAAVPLPAWTAEFDCASWAQFSLKYILANPQFTCVLTETTNPVHMAENIGAARGGLPDAAARERMRQYIDAL